LLHTRLVDTRNSHHDDGGLENPGKRVRRWTKPNDAVRFCPLSSRLGASLAWRFPFGSHVDESGCPRPPTLA
jgi:hypothetical protein